MFIFSSGKGKEFSNKIMISNTNKFLNSEHNVESMFVH